MRSPVCGWNQATSPLHNVEWAGHHFNITHSRRMSFPCRWVSLCRHILPVRASWSEGLMEMSLPCRQISNWENTILNKIWKRRWIRTLVTYLLIIWNEPKNQLVSNSPALFSFQADSKPRLVLIIKQMYLIMSMHAQYKLCLNSMWAKQLAKHISNINHGNSLTLTEY